MKFLDFERNPQLLSEIQVFSEMLRLLVKCLDF